MKSYPTLLFLLLFSLPSIAQKEFIPIGNQNNYHIDYENVTVLLDSTKIPENAIQLGIAILHSNKESKAYKGARKLAGKNGGNIIIKVHEKLLTDGEKTLKFWVGSPLKNEWRFDVYFSPSN